jgi:hypothetical protein
VDRNNEMRYLRIVLFLLMLWPVLAEASTPNTWTNTAEDGAWETDANWSESHKPTADEVATFDETSVDACTVNASISVSGISMTSGYNPSDQGLAFMDGVDVTAGADGIDFDGTEVYWLGEHTITVSGATVDLAPTAVHAVTTTLDLVLTGTADQTVTGAVGVGDCPDTLTISKTSGNVTLDDIATEVGAVTMGDGDVAVTDSTITSSADAKAVTGDVNLSDAENNVNLGASTWTITDGTLDYHAIGTFTTSSCTLILAGTGQWIGKQEYVFGGAVQIPVGAVITVPSSGSYTWFGTGGSTMTINGIFSVAAGEEFDVANNCKVSFGSHGKVTGDGTYWFTATAGAGIQTFAEGASIDVANVVVSYPNSATSFASVVWDCGTVFKVRPSGTLQLANTQTFNCPVEFETAGTLIVNNSENNPTLVFNDDVTFDIQSGGVTWTKGTKAITLSGTDQTIDFEDKSLEPLVVNCSGTLTFADGWTSVSYTQSAGDVDFNGETFITTGNFTVAAGATLSDPESSDLTVGGNLSLTGTYAAPLDLGASDTWTLSTTGSRSVIYCIFGHCDASGGTIRAVRSINDGGNQNVLFPRQRPTMRMTGRSHPFQPLGL